MSEYEKKNISRPFGGINITESGDYGKISTNGSIKANVPFSVERLSVNGSVHSSDEVSVEKLSINGKTIVGALNIQEKATFNGKVKTNRVSANKEAKLVFNGKIITPEFSGGETIKINGHTEIDSISDAQNLKINGRVISESIEVKELVIDIKNSESKIGLIKADNVEIGVDLNRDYTRHKGFAEINEIQATGKVEIDHCKVNKVIAKELFAGEAVEIGEFIELLD
ncbi:MAG: hypothetical protein ACXAC7_22150 [Candidatus Hodarchaeales archaeon]